MRSERGPGLLRRELGELALSPRTLVVAALLVGLMLAAAAEHGRFLRQAARATEAVAAEHRAALRGLPLDRAADFLHPAPRPPWALAFATGDASPLPAVHRQGLSPLVDPLWEELPVEGKPPALHWLFLFQTVLSLAAFGLAYDAIVGERQRGILRQVLSYPISRPRVLLAKLFARWLCLAVPLAVGATLGYPLAARLAGGALPPGSAATGAATVGLAGLATVLFLAVAVLVSTLSRTSTGALVVLALLWIGATQLVPTAATVLARRLHPVPSPQTIEARLAAARGEDDDAGGWRRPAVARQDDFRWERRAAEIQNRRYQRQETIRRAAAERRLQQVEAGEAFALLSPTAVLGSAVTHLAGAATDRDRGFLDQTARYRQTLGAHLAALDGADPESPHIHFFSGYLSQRPLVPPDAADGDLPLFTFQELSARDRLHHGLPYLLLLLLETLAALGLALWAFGRADVR